MDHLHMTRVSLRCQTMLLIHLSNVLSEHVSVHINVKFLPLLLEDEQNVLMQY